MLPLDGAKQSLKEQLLTDLLHDVKNDMRCSN